MNRGGAEMEMFQIAPPLRVLRMKKQSMVILDGKCGNNANIPVFIHPRNIIIKPCDVPGPVLCTEEGIRGGVLGDREWRVEGSSYAPITAL